MTLAQTEAKGAWTYCRPPRSDLFGSVRPNSSWPVEPRDVDARECFCCRISAFASAHAHRGGLALWAHYGTAVFYEMIVAGIAACL
jgi:hypothetical protein